MVTKRGRCANGNAKKAKPPNRSKEDQRNQLYPVGFLLTAIRKCTVPCPVDEGDDEKYAAVQQMEIGWPTNVQHITHVTYDRFNGFQGLPVEFEVEIPGRIPSASASVFGVSAESMQCSFDSRGNSVPTMLLLMQEKLYREGGLRAEGIFCITPANSKEEHVRQQLNRGIVPDNIDVHCLASLIKAWFRELPSGVLDRLSTEQVVQCNTEEESVGLVKQLKPTESALLNWAVELMADVVEEEEFNKINARNIAMVFAPNMTKMSDPLMALMHAVQVTSLLRTLIMKTLREREEAPSGEYSTMSSQSNNQQIDKDSDIQQQMDTSCEARVPASDDDTNDNNCDHIHFSHSEGEVQELSEIEGCFLWRLSENQNVKSYFLGQPSGKLQRDYRNYRSSSGINVESGVSSAERKKGNSRSSTSDGEGLGDSRKWSIC